MPGSSRVDSGCVFEGFKPSTVQATADSIKFFPSREIVELYKHSLAESCKNLIKNSTGKADYLGDFRTCNKSPLGCLSIFRG